MEDIFQRDSNFTSESKPKPITTKFLILIILVAIAFMFFVCLGVFFFNVRGAEQVLVPNVVGRYWSEALIDMQQKELYPKIQMRYTDNAADAGRILSQNPIGGSITKAGSRVTLTISRGAVISHVENYVGQNIEDVRMNLKAVSAETGTQIIYLDNPSYKTDNSPVGTILAQNPAEGTPISEPITLKLIVSRGSEAETAKVSNFVGMSIDQILKVLGNTNLVLDFTSHIAVNKEKPATITRQETPEGQLVKKFSRVLVDVALPEGEYNKKLYGIYQTKLPDYPFPVAVNVEIEKGGRKSNLVTLKHSGGNFTVPYAVEKGTELKVIVSGKELAKTTIE